MTELYCPQSKDESVQANGKIDAMMQLRCRDCPTRKGCKGPVFKDEKAPAPATPRRGRKPKAETGPEKAPAVTQEPERKPQETEREAACRAALLGLRNLKNTLTIHKIADGIVTKFRAEIAAARSAGIGWKPISDVLRKHGFPLGWHAAQKAFERLEAKEAGE